MLLFAGALMWLLLAWDWNWFRPFIESAASEALGRELRVADLDVDGWPHPTVVLHRIRIGNPAGFVREDPFATVQRLEVQFDPAALLDRTLSLLLIHVERPQLALFAPPEGPANWVFPTPSESDEPPPLELVIRRLSIADGEVHVLHPGFKSDFRAKVFTRTPNEAKGDFVGPPPGPRAYPEAPAEASTDEPEIHVEAKGRYAGQPLSARFVGGSVLALREEADPYPISLDVANGPTRLGLKGTLIEPLRFAGARLALSFQGPDMSLLYPLTGVPLPPTAPFRIEGRFDYADGKPGPSFRFSGFTGTVGSSDLSGSVAVQTGGPRLRISGEMRSKNVLLADLGGLVGAAPGEADAKGTTTEQKTEHARAEASPRLLPDKPINLPKLRVADFDLRYSARRIQSQDTPFDDLSAHLRIDDGVLSLRPLKFGVGGGAIATNLLLDGTRDLVRIEADADFRHVDFARILRETADVRGAGRIDGRASLRSHGNSVADILGAGNGKLRLSMAGGDMSALLIDLAGLDFGNALLSALGIPSRAELRCMIADLDLKDGLVNTELLLLDTTEASVTGTGTINLKTEQLDYRVQTEPKTLNIGSVAAPINIRGSLKNPKVRPDSKSLGVRGAAAVVLGVVATPLAALLATIQLGRGKDADCAALLEELRREASLLPRAPDPPTGRKETAADLVPNR